MKFGGVGVTAVTGVGAVGRVGGVARGLGTIAPRGVEGGSFAGGFSFKGLAKIGPVTAPVNEGFVSKAVVGISRTEVRFKPHSIFTEPLSAPKAQIDRAPVPKVFQNSLSDINLDPTKPARQPVPSVFQNAFDRMLGPKIPTVAVEKPAVKTPVMVHDAVRLIEVRRVIEKLNRVSAPIAALKVKQELSMFPQVQNKAGMRTEVRDAVPRGQKRDKDTRKFVEDDPVNRRRELDVTDAEPILVSQLNNQGIVEGEDLAAVLPDEDESRRSGIVKLRGPDGGYTKYIKDLGKAGKFKDVGALIGFAFKLLRKYTGVDLKKDGKSADDEQISNVLDRGVLEQEPVVEVARRLIRLEKQGEIKDVSGGEVRIEYVPETVLLECGLTGIDPGSKIHKLSKT